MHDGSEGDGLTAGPFRHKGFRRLASSTNPRPDGLSSVGAKGGRAFKSSSIDTARGQLARFKLEFEPTLRNLRAPARSGSLRRQAETNTSAG
jgi:hypothetical protein